MVSIKQSKFIKSLKIKKYRTREGCFIAEGRKNVLEAVDAGYGVRHVLATESFIESNSESLKIVENKIIPVSAEVLSDLGTFQTNNDCLAVLESPQFELADLAFDDHVVVLDGVGDPGNLGTIIRTMDWFGLKHLMCSPNCADMYNPKVINSTMGSFTRVSVYYTDLVPFLKEAPLKAYGADLDGVSVSEWQTSGPVILVMGSESHGIGQEVEQALSGKVTIPKIGGAESLNVAIATGILCHQLRFN